MWYRREFIKATVASAATGLFSSKIFSIPANRNILPTKIKFGIISDLHHLQFGISEQPRLKAFMDEVSSASPDFIVQCGDFCRPQQSEGILAQWNRFKGPKYHVLGNHDMDVCNKETIMKLWGMKQRYYSFDYGGFHFVILDRNFLRKEDNSLIDYDNSNWGPLAAPYRSFTDTAQLEWLRRDLAGNEKPVIVFMHQPVFLSDYYDELGNADDILRIFDETNFMSVRNKKNGKVAAVFMGHDHDDRYGIRNDVHYFIINSSSYVYNEKPHFFKDAIFAFVTLDTAGKLIIEGRKTVYRDTVPENILMKFPTSISNREIII